MQELTLLEVIKYAIRTLISSKVFALFLFEITILIVALIFSRLMDKKIVRNTCIFASLIVLVFYVSNYVSTVLTFFNNVSTRLIELIYFPTTLEFMIMMIISFAIMFVTLLNKKTNRVIKIINMMVPITVSFILLCIIEYINVNNIAFDEFSVFTNPVLSSLYQLGMGTFIAWLLGLGVYKIDKLLINQLSLKVEDDKTANLTTVNLPVVEDIKEEEEIELPRLKENV